MSSNVLLMDHQPLSHFRMYDLRRLDFPLSSFMAADAIFHASVGRMAVSRPSESLTLHDWRLPPAADLSLPLPASSIIGFGTPVFPAMDLDRLVISYYHWGSKQSHCLRSRASGYRVSVLNFI